MRAQRELRQCERWLRSRFRWRRSAAALQLGSLGGQDAERLLMQAAQDQASDVRLCALISLFRIDPDRDHEPIVQSVRRGAYGRAPSTYVDPTPEEAIDLRLAWCHHLPLRQWFEASTRPDAPLSLRLAAIEALGVSRDPGARPALKTALADEDPVVRDRAAAALGWLTEDLADAVGGQVGNAGPIDT